MELLSVISDIVGLIGGVAILGRSIFSYLNRKRGDLNDDADKETTTSDSASDRDAAE